MSRTPALAVAAGLFSIVPMPPRIDLTRDEVGRALGWFWFLGALLGLVAGLVGTGALLLSGAQLLAAVLSIVVLQGLVGAMHLDGLADSTDGLAALGSRKDGRDLAAALDVMRRPDIGAAGVVAICCVLLLQVAALSAAPSPAALLALLIVAAANGRLAVVAASRPTVPAARPGGFGALISGVTPLPQVIGHMAGVLLLASCLGWWAGGALGALALAASALVALGCSVAWTHRLVNRLGGMTGDLFGALVEVTTTITLISGALALAR